MAQYKLFGKDLTEYEDIDIDDLLNKLTPEEIEELGQELIDPDDSHIPPSDRCRYKTDKVPTGPFNRKALIDFLAKKAREEKDWDENKPYTKEIRGKIWKRKEEEKIQIHEDDAVATEWDEVLANATEEELVDLAAILGFHGMLNQVQYHQAFVEGKDESESEEEDEEGEKKHKKEKIGFQGVAKHQNFKLVPEEPPNMTDVEGSLKKIKANDPKLKEVNLNNIKGISLSRLCEFGAALKENTNLEQLQMANIRATDKVAKALAEGLKDNKTLKCLNLESNYVSGEGLKAILDAVNKPQTLTELRVANQRPQVLGVQCEQRIADLVGDNYTLLKFGIFLTVPDARVRLQEYIQRNNDAIRIVRTGGELPPRGALKCVDLPPSRRKLPDYVAQKEAETPTQNGKAEESEEESEEEDSDEE